MPKMTFEELTIALDAAIEAGEIYNVDFNDWKTYVASRQLNADCDQVRAEFMHAGKWEARTQEELAVIDALTDSIVQFPTKKLEKAMDELFYNTDDRGNGTVYMMVEELVRKWKPVGNKFRTLKPMIVKGRKPSIDPSKISERTLENTGTCGCCGKNVKLNVNGKLVAHGFTIRHGWQEGNCFGVGYEPVEVSPQAMIDYVKSLEAMRETRIKSKDHIEAKRPNLANYNHRGELIETLTDGDKNYQHIFNIRVANLETEIRHIGMDIEIYQEKIEQWVTRPLPDTQLAA